MQTLLRSGVNFEHILLAHTLVQTPTLGLWFQCRVLFSSK